jgi:hypothetical protein
MKGTTMKFQEVLELRGSDVRLERMKPLLDRMPDKWGTSLPEPGWDDLLLIMDKTIADLAPDYEIYQAKEKFGVLRLYLGGPEVHKNLPPLVKVLVRGFEKMSEQVCEYCGAVHGYQGAKVYARPFGWVKTLCDTCCVDNGGKV